VLADRAVGPGPVERRPKVLLPAKLDAARTIATDMGEQRNWIVGANPEFEGDRAALPLAVGEQSEQVGQKRFLLIGAVRDGHGQREGNALITLGVAEADEPRLVLRQCSGWCSAYDRLE